MTKKTPSSKSVAWNHLRSDGDVDNELYYFGDSLFSGVANSFSKKGILLSSHTFVDGHVQGCCRRYHENGSLAEESQYWQSRLHGIHKCWSPEGNLTRWGLFEFDIPVSDYQWDNQGQLIEEYHISDELNERIAGFSWDDIEDTKRYYKQITGTSPPKFSERGELVTYSE